MKKILSIYFFLIANYEVEKILLVFIYILIIQYYQRYINETMTDTVILL